MSKKKSFLVYFDSCPHIALLPDDQVGMMFRAMMECARLEAEGEDGRVVLECYPDMLPATQMAFHFIAATIRRDMTAYSEKCANYAAAAKRRKKLREEQTEGTASGAVGAGPDGEVGTEGE